MSDNAQVVRDAYQCFERGDIPSLLEMMSDDVEWTVPRVVPQGGEFRGRDGVGEFFAGLGQKWSELEVDSRDLVADDHHAIALGVARGRRPGGEQAEYGFCHAFTIEDGEIVRFREYVAVDEELA